jgi:hypothetical protein
MLQKIYLLIENQEDACTQCFAMDKFVKRKTAGNANAIILSLPAAD